MGMTAGFIYDICTKAFVILKHLPLIPTGQITESIFALRTGTANCFIYKKGSDMVAIDAGFGASIVKRELSVLGIDPAMIAKLFLTHADIDHASGLPAFQNAQVYLSPDEEPMATGETARKFGMVYNRKISREYSLLKEGDEAMAGEIKVKAIETPGHTPGSMSYLIDGAVLFVGDAFKLVGGKASPIGPFYCMNPEKQKESIRKIAKLKGIQALFTAHTGFSGDFDGAMADWQGTA